MAELTDSEKEILKFIRNSVPMPNENTLMQKVITVEDIEKYRINIEKNIQIIYNK